MNRRRFTQAALGALAAAQFPGLARAQAIANLKMMIPANPGGGWDQTGRALAAAMQSAKVAGSVQFDNKGGAGGTLGLAQFINTAKGDPNALMVGGMVMVGGILLNKSAVDLSMVTPIARLTSEYEIVVVPAASPHKSMADLMNAYKADPGKVSWHGGSAGGTDHILAGLIVRAAGGDPAKVNYVAAKGGGDQIANIIGGHVTAGIAGISEFAEHVKGGRMRALAVSSPERKEGIPTLKEQGLDVVLGNWRSVFGGPGLSAAQRDGLVGTVKAAVDSPAWKETLAKYGWDSAWLSGDAFKAFLDEDTKRVAAILDSLGLRK
ncbi:MAG: tripartite tricarboxylate transporter substrate-binding protein [Betaproteobacteria bacterium]|jgi:putative tricarboxylic transport membrane protein|nr:tripartite tricarboxylate transporter substrate-binding protein [Betaproteobacteria bacterium]MDH5287513.1 tripartite tricarboxylate transporter substrate-binding protein [Betaproteobacteria bacterium]